MQKERISQQEIDEARNRLAQIRGPENMPTKQEVIEMILRMKKRWGITCDMRE